ncbi:MAG: DNA polymerase III subunit delta [Syntrophaceae bacterium PtaU1.Bin231]|nr:MAG: DNA polymerase III subunit delta [Syntrophaceae bacterium PtaU1.Bin231]
MSLEQVLDDLREGTARPCYLLYGEEEYRLKSAVDRILDGLLPSPERDLQLFVTEGEDEDIDRICESLLTPSLFPGRKVLLVRETRLLSSADTSSDRVRKIRDLADQDSSRAAREFLRLIRPAGWSLEDLTGGGWQRIPEARWREVLGEEAAGALRTWLPKVLAACEELPGKSAPPAENDERLVQLLLGGLPEQNHLILTASSADRRKRLFKAIAQCGAVLHFPREKKESVQKGQLREEARQLLQTAGKELSPPAWESLGRKTGFDLRTSINALRQLIVYAGDRPVIEPADVEALIGKTREESVFDLTDALSKKDAVRSLSLLGELLRQGVHHLMILSLMTREIRHLFQARIFLGEGGFASAFDAGMEYPAFVRKVYPLFRDRFSSPAAKKSGSLADSHPFVVFQALKRCRSFSSDDLAGFLEELLRLDVAFKSTAADPQLSLERFLLRVCR